ncbi:MAG: hypothetical protein HN348_26215, partial [Proteobacteria bacterium]|nr:hypothetical protein [Pseudomonadota bacterium]
MQDVDGEIAGAVIVVTDVRELTKTHRKLKETQAQLVQAGKMIAIGQLAGAVAHEINNPLAAILLSADCLAEDLKYANPPREFSSWPTFVNRIRLGVERCQRVTLSLLDFAHQSPSTSDRLDLCQVVERTLALGVAPPLIRDCVVSPDPPD